MTPKWPLLLLMAGCSTTPEPTPHQVYPILPLVRPETPVAPPPRPATRRIQSQASPMASAPAGVQVFVSRKVTPAPAVMLGWDPSPTTWVTGYNLYQGPASGVYTNTTNAGNANSITVSNLSFSATYYFAVTAYTGDGLESEYSNELVYSTPGAVLSPGNLRVTGSFALSPDGPWMPETNWPPIIVSSPAGNMLWRVEVGRMP